MHRPADIPDCATEVFERFTDSRRVIFDICGQTGFAATPSDDVEFHGEPLKKGAAGAAGSGERHL